MLLVIRDATARDAGACAAIYAPYVTGTVITLEDEPPTIAEMAEPMAGGSSTRRCLPR